LNRRSNVLAITQMSISMNRTSSSGDWNHFWKSPNDPDARPVPDSRLGHEQDAGVTSAHSRATALRVACTRTQAPAGSRLSSLLGSLLPT